RCQPWWAFSASDSSDGKEKRRMGLGPLVRGAKVHQRAAHISSACDPVLEQIRHSRGKIFPRRVTRLDGAFALKYVVIGKAGGDFKSNTSR
ncbi:hypothetical protein, partial [Enterococcus faecium]|uniref:hypothetical protein n=1 Tax=Enterococcus faecium TaxID=1352 RepID=UPI003F428854